LQGKSDLLSYWPCASVYSTGSDYSTLYLLL
jgi:hypothetical protein